VRKIAHLFEPAGAARKPIAAHDAAALDATELDEIAGGRSEDWPPPPGRN
jgi:hypothetical protein